VGHYARPDVFRLMVYDSPAPPVVRLAADTAAHAVTGRPCGAIDTAIGKDDADQPGAVSARRAAPPT
jgi:hypothetical protein